MIPVIKNVIYQNDMIQYFLENTGGSSQKETGKKEKRWQERAVVSVLWKVPRIFTLTDCISFQYMHKCRKEVFLLLLNSGDFSLYLYPGIMITFYFEHIYSENMLKRPFLFHLNYVYLSSLVSVLGFMLCSLIFNLNEGEGLWQTVVIHPLGKYHHLQWTQYNEEVSYYIIEEALSFIYILVHFSH